MKVLALDSSGLVASVALLEDETMIAEYTVNYKKTHSQTLLPMLDEIVRMTEQKLDSIDAIAVAAGPGSFTGLRIGSATAKGLAQALNKPIISVPTVDALAYNLYGTDQIICPIMDARRNQVYTGIYEFVGNEFHVLHEQYVDSIENVITQLNEKNRPIIFIGDGIPPYSSVIEEMMQVPFSFAPSHLCRQRAGAVGNLAIKQYGMTAAEDASDHKPEYLRLSQAERERAEQEKSK
jgi:tRNA threonylcarbamoyladenosine biosynthesis protein TsaB